MLRKSGFPLLTLLGMLVVFSPAPAGAQVRFGVTIGGPARYGYVAPPVYPAYEVPYDAPYDSYYQAPAYPYYRAPVYVGPSYGYGYRGYARPYYNNYRGGGYRGGGNYRGGEGSYRGGGDNYRGGGNYRGGDNYRDGNNGGNNGHGGGHRR